MQLQKDIKGLKIYSKLDIAKENIYSLRFKKVFIFICAMLILGSLSVVSVALNSTGLSIKEPEYFLNNAIITDIYPDVTYYISDKGGEEKVYTSKSMTVEDVLKLQNISINETCVLNYDLDTRVSEGMKIIVDSITYVDVSVNESIPYQTENINVTSIPKNTTKIQVEGKDGLACNTYKKKYINGIYHSEELIDQNVINEPVNEVVQCGVGGTFVGKDGVTYEYSYYLDVVATCYGEADGYSGSITATGTQARVGVIAVDPKTIPLGSKVFVTGSYRELGVCYAEDTGGFIKGNRIDVYLEGTLQQLLEFGRREMRVYILE